MALELSGENDLAAAEKLREEMLRYRDLFRAAFDELHEEVVKHVKTPGQYVGVHHDYPIISFLDSGFPSFREVGFYQNSAPRDFVGSVRPSSLLGLLSGLKFPAIQIPKGAALASFLRGHEIGKRFDLDRFAFDGATSDLPVDHLVGDAVERYLHLYGLDAAIDTKRRDEIIERLILGTVCRSLNLRLVVPIIMTHFEVEHFALSETTYIARLPRKMQLARARMSTHGTGASQGVVGAATHALVSNGWHLEVDNIIEVRRSLSQTSANVVEAIDTFFGALRVACCRFGGHHPKLTAFAFRTRPG